MYHQIEENKDADEVSNGFRSHGFPNQPYSREYLDIGRTQCLGKLPTADMASRFSNLPSYLTSYADLGPLGGERAFEYRQHFAAATAREGRSRFKFEFVGGALDQDFAVLELYSSI